MAVLSYLGRMTQHSIGVVPEWTLGDRLRKARERTGLGQKEFAEQLGVSRNTVSNAENGSVDVRRITVNAWSVATDVSIDWLMTGEGSSTPPDGPVRIPDAAERDRRIEEGAARNRRRGRPDTPRYVLAAA